MSERSLTPLRLIAHAQRFCQALSAQAADYDRRSQPNLDAFTRIAPRRSDAMRVPRQFGSADGSIPDMVELVIALAKGNPSGAQALLPHFVFVERTLLMASPAQTARFLGQVAQGTLVGGASAEIGGRFRG